MAPSRGTSPKKAVKKAVKKHAAAKTAATGRKTAPAKAVGRKAAKKKTVKKTTVKKKGAATSRKKTAAQAKMASRKKTARKTPRSVANRAGTAPRKKRSAAAASSRRHAAQRPRTQRPQPAQTGGPKYEFSREIPQKYHQTYLRALPRDPEWMFLYWEITPDSLQHLSSEIGDKALRASRRIVRVVDTTDTEYDGVDAQTYYDTEVSRYADNWYLKVPDSGRTYVVEIGHLTVDGTFGVLARSNPVTVPNGAVSHESREEWATVDTDELIRFSGEGLKTGDSSSPRNPWGYLGSGSSNL